MFEKWVFIRLEVIFWLKARLSTMCIIRSLKSSASNWGYSAAIRCIQNTLVNVSDICQATKCAPNVLWTLPWNWGWVFKILENPLDFFVDMLNVSLWEEYAPHLQILTRKKSRAWRLGRKGTGKKTPNQNQLRPRCEILPSTLQTPLTLLTAF